MIVEKKKLSELRRAAYNPRIELKSGDKVYEQLKKSIGEFGYVEPIVWNKATGNIVGGHQRLTVLEDMGCEEVDVVVVEFDEVKEKALNLALNKVKGEWDYGALSSIIEEMQSSGYDFTLTGFTSDEVSDLLCEAESEIEIEEDPDPDEYGEDEEPTLIPVRVGPYSFTFTYSEWEDIFGQIRLDVGFGKEEIVEEFKRRLFESAV